jgi:CubicO group peptidase (beta-lactamase class C family)
VTKEYRSSNLGFALLGEGLVAAAGAADYESLVAERITGPLQMSATRVATLADEPTGYTATGRRAGNWDMSGFAGAGSLRSTLGDMTGYLSAQADGSAPGVRATEPVKPVDGQQIGYAWMTTGDITWHNGKTGGFASFAGFDRQSGRAVVVLSNTAVPVDDLGMALLEDRS